jgi:hypothetical protein
MSGPGYDPKIIERFADQLLRKADTVRVGFAVGGGIFGTFVGAVPLTPLKSVWGVPAGFGVATIIVGALLGVLVGYVIGEGRAFRYRVQAQSAIFQLEIERRVTSAVAEAVSQAAAPAAAAPQAQAVAPAPEAPAVAVMPPPLTPVETPTVAAPLLRPPGAPTPTSEQGGETSEAPAPDELPPLSPAPAELPPVTPADDLPPLSPAANG